MLNGNTYQRDVWPFLRKKEVIFHIGDLANLWEITDRNTLRVTLKRYVDDGLLYKIYRGFYSIHPFSELKTTVGFKTLENSSSNATDRTFPASKRTILGLSVGIKDDFPMELLMARCSNWSFEFIC